MWAEFGFDDAAGLGMVLGLLLFGLAYNLLVDWLEKSSRHEGYTAFLVVGGVLVTLGGMEGIGWAWPGLSVFINGLMAFAASGTPMVLGSMWRHIKAREQARAASLREALEADGDTEGGAT